MASAKKSTQKIFFAHSAGPQYGKGKGSYDLVNWLRSKLAGEYKIMFPVIEKPTAPTYAKFKKIFAAAFAKLTGPVIVVGHSLGGSLLLKYLSEEKPAVSIAALFLVSTPHWGSEMKSFELKPNFQAALKDIPAVYLYHSKNDRDAPFSQLKFYEEAFKNAVVHELPGKEHVFAKGLPQLLKDIISL